MSRGRYFRKCKPSYTDGVVRYLSRQFRRRDAPPNKFPPKGILHTEYPLNYQSSYSLLTYFCVQSGFEPKIEIRKVDCKGVLFNIEEWKKLMSLSEVIDQHLQQTDNFMSYPSSVPMGRFEVVFIYHHSIPQLCIRARDDAPMNIDGMLQSVNISPQLWLKIKSISPIINNFATQAEQHQNYGVEALQHLKFLYEAEVKSKQVTDRSLDPKRSTIRNCVEKMLEAEDAYRNGIHSSFNLVRFCYELVVYYPYLI